MAVLKQNFKSPPTSCRRETEEDNGVTRRAVIFRSLKETREREIKRSLKKGVNVITAVGCIICAAFQGGMEGGGGVKSV